MEIDSMPDLRKTLSELVDFFDLVDINGWEAITLMLMQLLGATKSALQNMKHFYILCKNDFLVS